MAENKRDYYEVLGVQKGAGAEEIKKAYRKLSLLFPISRASASVTASVTRVGPPLSVLSTLLTQ